MKRFGACLLLLFFACTMTACQNGAPTGDVYPTASIAPTHAAMDDNILQPLVVGADLLQEVSTKSLLYADPYTYVRPRPQVLPNVLDFENNVLTLESSQRQTPTELFDEAQGVDLTKEIISFELDTQETSVLGTVVGNTQLAYGLSTEDSYFDFTIDDSLTITEYFRDGTPQRTVFSMPGGVGAYGVQLASGEQIFLIHHIVDEKDRETIIKLDMDGKAAVLLDGAQATKSFGYSAIAAQGEDIYLVKQVVVADSLKTSIVVLDKNGEEQKTISLPGLERYSNPEYFADRLYVAENFVFIKWYRADNSEPYMTIFALEGENVRKILFDSNSPSVLLHIAPIENRFLIFRAFPAGMDYQDASYERELIVFDMQTEHLKKLIIDCDPSYRILQKDVDSDGTILISLTPTQIESGQVPQYLIAKWEDIRLLLLDV